MRRTVRRASADRLRGFHDCTSGPIDGHFRDDIDMFAFNFWHPDFNHQMADAIPDLNAVSKIVYPSISANGAMLKGDQDFEVFSEASGRVAVAAYERVVDVIVIRQMDANYKISDTFELDDIDRICKLLDDYDTPRWSAVFRIAYARLVETGEFPRPESDESEEVEMLKWYCEEPYLTALVYLHDYKILERVDPNAHAALVQFFHENEAAIRDYNPMPPLPVS